MFRQIKRILGPKDVKEAVPVPREVARIKAERDNELKRIFASEDSRKVFIIGPCSADNEDAVVEYVRRLGKLQEEVKEKLFLVPRIYTNKPRTRGEGYKGMLHNPDPHVKGTDIEKGIFALRHMHIRAAEESRLTAADEMLYPENHFYLDDLLSYVAVGARSSEDQQHRLTASGVDVPVGIKNSMNGSFPVLLNSIYASQIPNEFKYRNYQVKTDGNPYAHAILRGSVDVYGNNIPNYHFEDVSHFLDMYLKEGLKNPAIVIDTNHSNSGKKHREQVRIVGEVVENLRYSDEMKRCVKGFLVESYLEDGAQSVDGGVFGKSITDPCIGWETTERLILDTADKL